MSAAKAGQGLATARIRHCHHHLILQRLCRLGEISKAELAWAVRLNNTAIGRIFTDFQDFGLVSVIGKRYEGQGGHPGTAPRLKPNGGYGIGIRRDRRRMETALVDLGGCLSSPCSHEAAMPPLQETLAIAGADVEAFYETAEDQSPGRVLGIGLAGPYHLCAWLAPPPLDLNDPALKLWDDSNFAAAQQTGTGFDMLEENDGTVAAIAEPFPCFGRECDDFAFFFLGPAIGGNVILHCDYRRCLSGNAGDVATLPVSRSILASAPPVRGSYEVLLTRASMAALARHLTGHGHLVTELETLPTAIAACPQGFDEWLEDRVAALISPLMAAQTLLDVSSSVIDGDFGAEVMTGLTEGLRYRMGECPPEDRLTPSRRVGTFSSNARLLRAASLPLDFASRVAVGPNARPLKGGHDTRVA